MKKKEYNELNERKLKAWNKLRDFIEQNQEMSYEYLLWELKGIADNIYIDEVDSFQEIIPTWDEVLYMREVIGWKELLTLLARRVELQK